MAVEFEQSETVESSSTFCNKPGKYHVVITNYEENPVTRSGNVIEGGFAVTTEIVAGTVEDQVGKTLETTFYPPSENHKDGGEFAKKRMTRFYLAINKGVHQPGQRAVVSYDTVVGRQFILEVKEKDGSIAGKKYIEADGLKMYHVDDILAQDIPKSEAFLMHIEKDLRMNADLVVDSVSMDDL